MSVHMLQAKQHIIFIGDLYLPMPNQINCVHGQSTWTAIGMVDTFGQQKVHFVALVCHAL